MAAPLTAPTCPSKKSSSRKLRQARCQSVEPLQFDTSPEIDLRIITPRLILEPIQECHAEVMVDALSDPSMYRFIPHDPPGLDNLKLRYQKWEPRISPNGDEIWLNWAARLKPDGPYIGHFQSSYKEDRRAIIAYMLAPEFQGQGYAQEATASVIKMLFKQLNIVSVKAWIDTRNEKSIRLVRKLGMRHTETIEKADHFKGEDSDEFVFEILCNEWKTDAIIRHIP